MNNSITLPRSIKATERRLNELGGIAHATDWERAVLVAMCVDPGTGQGRRGTSDTSNGGLQSASAFAERKLHGLTTHRSVLFYAHAWLDRFDRPRPGVKIQLPHWCGECDIDAPHDTCYPFPAFPRGTDGHNTEDGAVETIKRITKKHRKAISRAAEEDDDVAEATADAIEEAAPVRSKVVRRQAQRDRDHKDKIDQAADEMEKLRDRINDQYEETDTGTADKAVQAIIHIIRDGHEAELLWAMEGGHRAATSSPLSPRPSRCSPTGANVPRGSRAWRSPRTTEHGPTNSASISAPCPDQVEGAGRYTGPFELCNVHE